MKKISTLLVLLAGCFAAFAQNNKKLIVGNWTIEKVESGGTEIYNRSNKATVFESFKKMAVSDTTVFTEADSLQLLEFIKITEKTMGSLAVSFDAKGGHTTSSYDDKTKKTTTSKGIYKFAPDDENVLMIKMAGPENTFEPANILQLVPDTLTFEEISGSANGEKMTLTFKRKAVAVKKPVKKR